MTNLNQFESVFKAADKPQFVREAVSLQRITVIADLDGDECQRFVQSVQGFLPPGAVNREWNVISGSQFSRVGALLQEVGAADPDLICTYRNLQIPATEYPYSLGVYVDVLTQVSTTPVLLIPHPELPHPRDNVMEGTKNVMAITDHLAGDHHLVSYAAALTQPGGTLWLTHVEDRRAFERFMRAIGKSPGIDTESAREELMSLLLKEPHDYIRSCITALQDENADLRIEEVVTSGHQLSDYKKLVDAHDINLLIMNTKDQDQLAMHGVAYPLSVEMRDTPLLLL